MSETERDPSSPDAALDQRLSDAFANPKAGKPASNNKVTVQDLMTYIEDQPPISEQDVRNAFDNPKAGGVVTKRDMIDDILAGDAAPSLDDSAARMGERLTGRTPSVSNVVPLPLPPQREQEDRPSLERDISDAFANPKAGNKMVGGPEPGLDPHMPVAHAESVVRDRAWADDSDVKRVKFPYWMIALGAALCVFVLVVENMSG